MVNPESNVARFYIITIVGALIVGYFLFVVIRGCIGLSMLVSSQRGWSDYLYLADAELGTRLSANANGYEILYGEKVPVRTDDFGNRIDEASVSPRSMPGGGILFIGDSFTFGAAVDADSIFPNLVARETGLVVHNAGVPSYGLAHMLRRTEELLPRLQPELVIFQYSPWLVDRAMNRYMDTPYGAIPQPYVAGRDKMYVHDPLRPFRLATLSSSKIIEGRQSFVARSWFVLHDLAPVIIKIDIDSIAIAIGDLWGKNPAPADNPMRVTEYAYEKMIGLAQEHGASTAVLVLGSAHSFEAPVRVFPRGVPVLDTQYSLWSKLKEQTQEGYIRAYWHWRGEPPQVIDYHPNETAHRIIALAIIEALQGRQEKEID